MKQLILLCVIYMFLGISCKKKSENTDSPATSSPVNNDLHYGELISSKYDFLNTSGLIPGQDISTAFFVSTGTTGVIITPTQDAGTVSMNGTTFKKTDLGTVIAYHDSTQNLYFSPYVWNISGSTSVPAINYTVSGSCPTYTGYSSLQDTIIKSQNNTILINGVNGADEIQVFISSWTSQSPIYPIPANSTSFIFKPSDLSSLGSGTAGYINVLSYKNFFELFGNKKYKFQIGYRLEKYVYLKP